MCKNAVVAEELQDTFDLYVIIGFTLQKRSESTVLERADDIERKAATRLRVAQQPIFCSSSGFHCGMSTMVSQAGTLYNFPAIDRIVKRPCLLDSDRVSSCREATVCPHLKHTTLSIPTPAIQLLWAPGPPTIALWF